MHDTDPTTNKNHLPMPELSPELAATYEMRDPKIIYELGCGDDRPPTQESLTTLAEKGTDPNEAMLRYYGGLTGVTRVLLLTLLAQGKREIIDSQFNGSFVDVMKNIKSDIEAKNKVRLALHTAEGNEGNPIQFDPTSENNVGCAYAANAATIAEICATDPTHAKLTQREGQLLGNTRSVAGNVQAANRALNDRYFTDTSVAGLTRTDFTEMGVPIQVLRGAHAAAEDTLVVMNFSIDQLSNSTKAAATGRPFYNNDVTQVAEMLIRTYPEFKLDPTTLFAVMDQDIRATRAALTGGNATELEQARIGNPEDAIAYLESVQASL